MSYLTQNTISTDPAMNGRVAQAAASEAAPAGNVTDPGADESVITDAMILSQVQTMLGSGT